MRRRQIGGEFQSNPYKDRAIPYKGGYDRGRRSGKIV
jgi:hypothetical protein